MTDVSRNYVVPVIRVVLSSGHVIILHTNLPAAELTISSVVTNLSPSFVFRAENGIAKAATLLPIHYAEIEFVRYRNVPSFSPQTRVVYFN